MYVYIYFGKLYINMTAKGVKSATEEITVVAPVVFISRPKNLLSETSSIETDVRSLRKACVYVLV